MHNTIKKQNFQFDTFDLVTLHDLDLKCATSKLRMEFVGVPDMTHAVYRLLHLIRYSVRKVKQDN